VTAAIRFGLLDRLWLAMLVLPALRVIQFRTTTTNYMKRYNKMENKMAMTIEELRDRLRTFADVRDWNQFHSPKNLVMALSGEVGELNEIFQWLNDEQIQAIKKDPEQIQPVREELADILLYLIRLADQMDIDIIDAARQKIEINKSKYPVEKSKGSAKKYNEL
jgi:dCTP diphosphatase